MKDPYIALDLGGALKRNDQVLALFERRTLQVLDVDAWHGSSIRICREKYRAISYAQCAFVFALAFFHVQLSDGPHLDLVLRR